MPLPTTIAPRNAVCVLRYPITTHVSPKVTATATRIAMPSETVERASRKNNRIDESTSTTTSTAVPATSLMIASYSAMKSGKLPPQPTRRCFCDSSPACESTMACSRDISALDSPTPSEVPAGRSTSVSEVWSGWTRNPST